MLKLGGVFLLSDTVAPEGDPEADWLNDVELRRDSSHQRDWKPSEWLALLEDTGLQVTHRSMAKVHLEFNDWVLRSATPQALIRPLRRDFLSAGPAVIKAFGIRPEGEDIHFHLGRFGGAGGQGLIRYVASLYCYSWKRTVAP